VDLMTPKGSKSMSSRSEVHNMITKLGETFSWDFQGRSFVDDEAKDYASGLSNEQCTMAIEAFNRYEDQLPEEAVKALPPILHVVLRAVVVGSYQVMEYFDRLVRYHFEDVQLVKELKELESKRKPIYLREWKVGDEK
jgi:hypothetical protein